MADAGSAGVGASAGVSGEAGGAGDGGDVDRHVVEQRGLWFEELDLGARYVHRPGRTLTEADNVFFTTLTMNTQPLHLDEAWSAQQPFGHRLINSLLTLSTLVGLSVSQLTLSIVGLRSS